MIAPATHDRDPAEDCGTDLDGIVESEDALIELGALASNKSDYTYGGSASSAKPSTRSRW